MPIILVALLLFGVLVSLWILVAIAVGHNHPKFGWAIVLVPLGVLLALACVTSVVTMFIPQFSMWLHNGQTVPLGPDVFHGVAGQASQMPPITSDVAAFGWVILLVVIVGAVLVITRTLGTQDREGRRHGLGRKLLLIVAVLIMARLWITSSRQDAARQQERVRQQIAAAKREALNARQQAEQVAATGSQSIQLLWDQINKPRIELEADDKDKQAGATTEAAAPEPGGAKASVAVANVAQDVAKAETDAGEQSSAAAAANEQDHADVPATKAAAAGDSPDKSAPTPRPAWADDPPKRVGNVWREVVQAGDYETVAECYQAADDLLALATWQHVRQLAGVSSSYADEPDGSKPSANDEKLLPQAYRSLRAMGISVNYIRHEIARDEYVEAVERSVGPMKRLYTRMEFSPSVDGELRQRWEAYERESRLTAVGTVGGLMVSLVGLVYGLLKIDTWTKGYYTKRLFLGVPAAIIGLVALAALALAA
jgi:hypothetical protein